MAIGRKLALQEHCVKAADSRRISSENEKENERVSKSTNLTYKKYNVIIAEKESHFGMETSSRNSEVIHAGIYYKKNSLKSELCLKGKKMLYQYW